MQTRRAFKRLAGPFARLLPSRARCRRRRRRRHTSSHLTRGSSYPSLSIITAPTQGEWEEYKGRRGTPKFLVLIVVVAVVSLLCVVCNRVSTVLSDVRGGESPMHGDEDDESPDVSSPDVSPHGSPIMSRAMQIMAGKTPKADRGTAERDPDSAAAGATAGSALLDLQPPKLVLSGSSPAAPAAAAAAAAVTSSSKAAASGQASGSVVTFSSSSTSSDKRSQELL